MVRHDRLNIGMQLRPYSEYERVPLVVTPGIGREVAHFDIETRRFQPVHEIAVRIC